MELLIPAILLFCGLAITGRMLSSGGAGAVFRGVLARDFFWLILRGLGALICLPFRVMNSLLCNRSSRSNRAYRGGRRRRHGDSSRRYRRRR